MQRPLSAAPGGAGEVASSPERWAPSSSAEALQPELDAEEALRLRAAYSEKELELLELQREHGQLASRFAETQDNYEEALEVKDKTIEQLAAALQARDDALEKHVATVQALRDVHACVAELQARTIDVEAAAKRRAEAARQYKQEAKRLQAELTAAQTQLASQKASAEQREQRLSLLSAQRAEHELVEQNSALALAMQRAATEAAERAAAEARRQLEEALGVRAKLESILVRLSK